jgi:hypothetical protein
VQALALNIKKQKLLLLQHILILLKQFFKTYEKLRQPKGFCFFAFRQKVALYQSKEPLVATALMFIGKVLKSAQIFLHFVNVVATIQAVSNIKAF